MKSTMISALAVTLAIASADPAPADQPEHLPGSEPLWPSGKISLSITTAGDELAGYLPNLIVGYTGEAFASEKVPSGLAQPNLTGFRGVSYNNEEFGQYYYLKINTKDTKPVTLGNKEVCPEPNIEDYYFDRNYDDKVYYFPTRDTPLNLWKACLGKNTGESVYILFWDANNSIEIDTKNDPKKCIKVDLHITDLSGRTWAHV